MSDFVIEAAEKMEQSESKRVIICEDNMTFEDWLDFITEHYDFDFWFQYLMS